MTVANDNRLYEPIVVVAAADRAPYKLIYHIKL